MYTHMPTVHSNTMMFYHLISESAQHPQPILTDQPTVIVQPQLQAFSKDMSYEQLAVWLSNHPQFVGADYQLDIRILKGTYLIYSMHTCH